MKTITFYSYKGGTGRSLALANAAIYLARLEFKVVALDFDLEAPGLTYKFSRDVDGEALHASAGVVDYLHTFVIDGNLPDSLTDFTIDVEVPGADKPLKLIPAGQAPSPQYWAKLARLDWHKLFYSTNANGVQLLLDLKNRIEDEMKPDFLLIDSRTGITEMGGVATTLLAEKVICLVLPTHENLDGARAVLRSVRRSRREAGLEEIEMMVALSRLPTMKEPEEEQELTERIQKFFNAEAADLRDTVHCPDIFVLHRESALEISESLRVGSGVSPDESILLRDYLRLFANVVPKHLIETKVGSLIELAKEKMWDNPEAAVKEVEELAESFGHPETYRALLRFYEVRNVGGAPAQKRAQRLWEITRDSEDQIVWQTLKRTFGFSQWPIREEWNPNLDFVEAVWHGAGNLDSEFGMKLAAALEREDKQSRAADVCLDIIKKTGLSTDVISRAVRLLDAAKRSAEADIIIQDAKPKLTGDPIFLQSWARHVLRGEDPGALSELIQPQILETLRRTEPLLASRLYLRAGLVNEANEAADEALVGIRQTARGVSRIEIQELGEVFQELGRWAEFQTYAQTSGYPPSYYGEVKTKRPRPLRRS